MHPSFLQAFSRLCEDACVRGWHEANGGNLSYLLSQDDAAGFDLWLQQSDQDEAQSALAHTWHKLGIVRPELAGKRVLITASGAHLRNIAYDMFHNAGIIEIDEAGASWRVVWGFEAGTRPSSELAAHLAIFAQGSSGSGECVRVVYHAHCPHVISLSTLIAPSSYAWTRTLWKCMTEGIIVFPQGIGALPWMVPGSEELAQATSETMEKQNACVWAQHGVIVRGSSFDEAFGIVETIEKCASIYLEARAANGGNEPEYMVSDDDLRKICERYGLHPNEEYLG